MTSGGGKSLAASVETERQAKIALLLCVFLGYFGAHRFYLRKYGTGLLYLFTLGACFIGWVADIVALARRRSEIVRGTEISLISDVQCSHDSACEPGGRESEYEKEMARQRELQAANRAFLEENGVDVDAFDAERVIADSLNTIESICPCMLRFGRGISHEEPSILFSSPTKAGKVPKNVVEAHLCHEERKSRTDQYGYEWFEYGDSLSVSISYMADGRINKLDVSGRHDGSSVSVAIRRNGDLLLMTSAGTHGATGEWQSLCPGADPSTGDILAALVKEVQRIY